MRDIGAHAKHVVTQLKFLSSTAGWMPAGARRARRRVLWRGTTATAFAAPRTPTAAAMSVGGLPAAAASSRSPRTTQLQLPAPLDAASVFVTHEFEATAITYCALKMRVLEQTSSGSHKFKVAKAIVQAQARGRANGGAKRKSSAQLRH